MEFQTQRSSFWSQAQEKQTLVLKEIAGIKEILERIAKADQILENMTTALELLETEEDPELIQEWQRLDKEGEKLLRLFELNHLLGAPHDKAGAILMINSGAGGTESMDWAGMLLRMYTRWAEAQGAKVTLLDLQPGEEAGIKSATLSIALDYAYGKLKTEMGVHRLVRISPFDANRRRHTSFASVAVYPDLDEEIEIEIKESDLRVDTYRASGAGGQHINKTDSAIRITHQPTGIVVQCQNERSQHKNRATAMKLLKAALYQLEEQKQEDERAQEEAQKSDIAWGSQIRSYVLHPYQLCKDYRSDWESGNVAAVLDGNLDDLIEANLAAAAEGEKGKSAQT